MYCMCKAQFSEAHILQPCMGHT